MDKKTAFQVNLISTANLGCCYNSATYEVLSRFPLALQGFRSLHDAGCFMAGQELRVIEPSKNISGLGEHNDGTSLFRAVVEIRCDSGD